MSSPTEIVCASRIESVVVHARGALVTRAVSLPESLPRDPVDLVVRGITVLASPGSARIDATGDRSVVALRTRRSTPAGPAARGDVATRRVAAERAFWKLDEARKRAVAQRDQLVAITLDTDLARRTRRGNPADRIADALAASQLVREQIEKVDDEIRSLDEAMLRNTRERESLALEESQARPGDIEQASSRRTLEFVLRLGASDANLRSLDLVYVVDAARWWPAYTARFANGGTKVSWSLEALVAQDSGEDWDAVRLSLSTADLVHDARLPELPSLRLGRSQPPSRRGFRPPPPGLDALYEGYDRARKSFGTEAPPPAPKAHAPSRPPVPRQAAPAAPMGGAIGSVHAMTTPPVGVESAGFAMPMMMDAPLAAAPPPPPARNAAAPAAPGFGSGGGGMPPPAPQAAMMRSALAAPMMEQQSQAAAQFGVADVPTGPDETWLDFDQLALIGPNDRTQRGRLIKVLRGDDGARQQSTRKILVLVAPPHAIDPLESRGHFDHRYDGDAKCDVASDARLHRVTLSRVDCDAEMRFRSVPREQDDVFREAIVKNPFDAPLLSGPVDVFFEGALLTTSSIAYVDRGGTIRVGLGVEERIRVARNARADESTAGLLGGSTAVDHTVSIDVSSSIARGVRVDILDRIPVTDDKDIEVSLTATQPRADEYDQADLGSIVRGGLRFRVDVPAGGKARIEFAYRIKLPAKSEVIGGNRRD